MLEDRQDIKTGRISRQAGYQGRQAAAKRLKARPRWLILFFSRSVISAKRSDWPSGWNTGS